MSEHMGTPNGWTQATVGELSQSIQYGHTASAENRQNGPRFLRITDIQNGGVDWSSVPSCSIADGDIDKYKLRDGDIVFARTGATTGKSYLIRNCPDAVFASYLIRLRMRECVDPAFLQAFFQTLDYWRQIDGGKRGIGQPNVNASVLAEIRLPVAPLPEQRRIVAKIEELFSDLDAGVAALERAKANLKRYRAAVLKAAVEGKLTEQWRADHPDAEPASQLLQRILTERRQKWEADQLAKFAAANKTPPKNWRDKYAEPSPPDTANLPPLPKNWCWASVDEACGVMSGQTPAGIADLVKPQGDIPWFKVGDMNHEENVREMTASREWLSRTDAARLGLHVHPEGTIIFPKRGGAIATNKKRLLVRDSGYDLNTMGILPPSNIALFVWLWFSGVNLAELSDGSYVPQINHKDIEPLPIPLPPEDEQVAIVAIADEMLTLSERAVATVERSLARAARLRQSILKQAFEGKLVPQDPRDEPASALLEQIRGSRGGSRVEVSSRAGDCVAEQPED